MSLRLRATVTRGDVALRCEEAKRLEDAGNYEGAAEVFGGLWQGPGHEPAVKGLEDADALLVLLRAGFITLRVAETRGGGELREAAKGLLSRAQRGFARLGDAEREAEAVNGLALCAWRQDDYDTARMLLADVMGKNVGEQRAFAAVALGGVEWSARRYGEALDLLRRHAQLFEGSKNHRLLAGYRATLGLVLRYLGRLDDSIIEDSVASYHLEKAGDVRQSAWMDNNGGNAYARLGRFEDARERFQSARRKFAALGDAYGGARVDDSEAQLCIAEGRPDDAERLAARAEEALAGFDAPAAYAEALTTRARALCRLGRGGEAWVKFGLAREMALDRVGSEEAGRIWEQAREELAVVLFSEPGMTYHGARHALERALIKRALDESDGNQTKAALMLGVRQQTLNQLLRGTHKDILKDRDQRLRA